MWGREIRRDGAEEVREVGKIGEVCKSICPQV